ncbi:unnamed protein product [Coregonus sp. 'balchen']|nr:unnamed protein product [Coregonus sp. 'balchen']
MLACGTVFFPGLFFITRKLLKSAFKSWNDADVVAVAVLCPCHSTTIVGFNIATASSDPQTVWFGAPCMSYIYTMYLSNYHSQKVKGHEAYKKHSLFTIKLFLLRHPLLVVHHMVLLTVFMPITLDCSSYPGNCLNQLSKVGMMQMCLRLLSSVHATLATIVGFIIATASSDVMSDRHRLTNEFVWFGAPYMAFDIYAMYLSNYHSEKVKGHEAYRKHSLLTIKLFLLRHPLLVVHHMVLLTVFMPITLFLRTGLGGDFFIGCFFMAEFSTPFVSLGKVLIQLGLEDSWLHRVNGVMVLLSFFTCRILLFPYMYWVYGQQYTIPFHKVPFHLQLHCNLANLTILAPQIYWFVLLCRKAYRLYLRQTRSKGQPAHKDGSKTD